MHAPPQAAIAEPRLELADKTSLSALRVVLAITVGSRVLVWCAGVVAASMFGVISSPGGMCYG